MARWNVLPSLVVFFFLLTRQAFPGEPPAKHPARTDRYGDPLPSGARFRLGTVRLRHEGTVNKLAWMPDGKTLASTDWNDPPVRLWRIADGKELRRINDSHLAAVRDGRALAWGSSFLDSNIHVLDLTTGKEVCRLKKNLAIRGCTNLDLSPDGKMILFGGLADSLVQLYSVDSGTKLLELDGAKKHYGNAIFSPDGKTILVGADGGVSCLNAATGAEVRTLATEGGSVFGPVFSPDGKRLAADDSERNGVIWVWSWPEAKLLHRLRCADAIIRDLAFSPDGKTLATAGDKGHGLRLWDVASGKQRHHLPAHEDQINAIAFSPDGSLLASAGDNRCVSLWDMRAAKPRLLTAGYRRFTAVAPTPDGRSLVTSEHDGALVLWDARDGHEIRHLQSWDHAAAKLTISPNGKWLAACTEGGPLGLWDLGTGRRKPAPSDVPATIGCTAFSPESDVVALGDEKGMVHVCAMPTGAKIRTIHRKPPKERLVPGQHLGVRALSWSSDGRTLAINYWDSGLTLYDPLRGCRRSELLGSNHAAETLAFSVDGRLLAIVKNSVIKNSSISGSVVCIYETATGQEVQRTPSFRTRLLSVAFAPDGRTVAFGGTSLELHYYNHDLGLCIPGKADFSVRLWDLVENKELRRFAGHALQVESLAFSPDGASLVSGSADAAPLCWDTADITGRPHPRGGDLSASRLAKLWTDLADGDAARAHKAIGELILSPDSVLSLLANKLAPVPPAPQGRLPGLLADLDSNEFVRREKATRELEQLGELAGPILRKALKGKPSLEARKRMEAILEQIERRYLTPDQLRIGRAVQVLESIGTPKAKQILEGLAQGASGASLTEEAKAALQRLTRRSAKP